MRIRKLEETMKFLKLEKWKEIKGLPKKEEINPASLNRIVLMPFAFLQI